jgi:hypothetical protein
MMDPFSISLIDLIEKVIKCGKTIKKVRDGTARESQGGDFGEAEWVSRCCEWSRRSAKKVSEPKNSIGDGCP